MKTKKYIKQLLRKEFDKQEKEPFGYLEQLKIIKHSKKLKYKKFTQKLKDDFNLCTEMIDVRVKLLDSINDKNFN